MMKAAASEWCVFPPGESSRCHDRPQDGDRALKSGRAIRQGFEGSRPGNEKGLEKFGFASVRARGGTARVVCLALRCFGCTPAL
jgi:hypothetical protein